MRKDFSGKSYMRDLMPAERPMASPWGCESPGQQRQPACHSLICCLDAPCVLGRKRVLGCERVHGGGLGAALYWSTQPCLVRAASADARTAMAPTWAQVGPAPMGATPARPMAGTEGLASQSIPYVWFTREDERQVRAGAVGHETCRRRPCKVPQCAGMGTGRCKCRLGPRV